MYDMHQDQEIEESMLDQLDSNRNTEAIMISNHDRLRDRIIIVDSDFSEYDL